MPFGTITATESTFGSISGSIVGAVPGTLSGSVGVPGPQGPVGPAGPQGPQGVPGVGGAWGSITGTLSTQTDLQTALDGKYSTSNPSGFITASALSPYLTSATAASTYQTLAGMSSYLTTAAAAAGYYPLTGNPSGFLTSAPVTSVAGRTGAITLANTDISGLGTMSTASASNYSTTAVADTLYAPIAAGLPTGGTVGQVLTKNSGTNFDASFATLIPGDRYLTTSTTSNTIGNGAKTFTVGTGLSYSSQQDVVISFDASNHMHALVTSYNSGTGVLVVDVNHHTGSGTYTAWTINVGGMVPLQSVEWGEILGTLGDQTDLATALNSKLELSGGVLTVNATIEASTATTSSLFAGDVFGVQLNANPSENSSLQYGGLVVQNAIGTMSVGPAGLTFPNASSQTVAYPGASGFLLKADNLSGLADTAVSRTNLGLGTMATATAADYSTTTVADGLYYPLTGNPSGFITSSALTGYATESWVTAGFYPLTGNPSGFITSSALTPYAPLAGATFTGLVGTAASTTTTAGLRIPHGVAPTTPVNGDIWTTTAGLFARQNGTTVQFMDLGGTQTVSGNKAFSNANLTLGNSTAAGTIAIGTGATISGATKNVTIGTNGVAGSTTNITIGTNSGGTSTATVNALLVTRASATTGSGLRVTPGVAPTSPVNGDVWMDTTNVYARVNGVTQTLPGGAATVAEAKLGNDTGKFINANVLQKVVNSPSYYKFPRGLFSTNVSGTGAAVTQGALIAALAGPSTGAGGSILRYYGVGGVDIVSGTGWSVGTTYDINFGKAFRLTGSTRLAVSTNTIVRVSFGKQANNGVGDPNTAAVGWRYNQAVGFIEIIAHDGATLKTLTTSSNPSGWFEWEIFNDGAGNVQMFVNDVSIGTRTGGCTTFSYASGPDYVEEIETTATPAAQPFVRFRNGGVFLQP